MPTVDKTWWGPVWRGLVVDPEGKHLRRLKGALGLYLYLIIHADRRTGRLARKYETVARDMGHSLWAIRGWMRRLDRQGYIDRAQTGRAMVIHVRRWRPAGHVPATLTGTRPPVRRAQSHRGQLPDPPRSPQRRGFFRLAPISKKSLLTRVIERDRQSTSFKARRSTDPEPRSRLELLATDLAQGLHDPGHVSRYKGYARRFPEPLLRRLMSEARATPERSLKRSKAALFEYLLRQHVLATPFREPNDSRD